MKRGAVRLLRSCVWCGASALFGPRISLAQEPPAVSVFGLGSAGEWLEPGHAQLSISRDIPRQQTIDPEQVPERDAVRLVFVGLGASPGPIRISTRRSDGSWLDSLAEPRLTPGVCPPGSPATPCWITLPVRLTADRLDRQYPAARERSLGAALGGELRVESSGRIVARFRVTGPRTPAFAAYSRLSARLRVRILRIAAGGAPAIGGDDASARRIARAEVANASKLWAQCGIDLEGPAGPDVEVVDPPALALIAVGCDAGLPASGGQIALQIGGHRVRIQSHAGEAPLVVAARISRALVGFGLRVELSPNPRTSAGASGAIDLLVRDAHGKSLPLSATPHLEPSTDATLPVCLGEVDLGNGLRHFVESDASAGTLEERALIKALDDGDPSTIDVLIVPSFDQSGRIGESFIDDDGAAIQNTVIIDRAAVRAGPRSYALAHELGHILLDMPGHPDDYGVDESSSLMDADAADASVFGPRRLSLGDCERVLRQSGPGAKTPLLQAWPLSELRAPATSER